MSPSGFRLQSVELYNWGTFDQHIWLMEPGGKSSLLTGANGSGKTTLVDAILTLLVPPQVRFYNQSSGAETRRDRSEESYTLGAYSTRQSETGLSAHTTYLRSREHAYSILIGSRAVSP
ncbi:MAG: ATP-binding protein [Bacteroidota bacterium]